MRGVLAVLLTLAALGCQHATTPSELDRSLSPGSSGRVLTTDRTSYAAGATALLTLNNVHQHSLGYNLCLAVTEQLSGGSWRTAEFGNERICTMELRLLKPGGTASYSFALDSRLPAGDYRFRTVVENMSSGARESVVSNTFRITR